MSTPLRRVARGLMVITAFTLTATACGGGAGAERATGHPILGFVPEDAVLYSIADWQAADEHADNFPTIADARDDMFREMRPSDQPVDYDEDVSPWIGDTAGHVQLSAEPSVPEEVEEQAEEAQGGDDAQEPASTTAQADEPGAEAQPPAGGEGGADAAGSNELDADTAAKAAGGEFFLWAEVTDREQAESFITEGAEEVRTEEHRGHDIHVIRSGDQTRAWAFVEEDELLLVGNGEQALRTAIDTREEDGDITGNSNVMDVAGEVDEDALVSVVISGDGVRQQIDDQGENQSDQTSQAVQAFRQTQRVQALHGVSMGLLAEQEGMRLRGYVGYDGDELPEGGLGDDFEPTLLGELPADTIMAVDGRDIGGAIEVAIEQMREDPERGQQLAQAEAALGVSAEDIGTTFDDQFALALLGSTGSGDGVVPSIGLVMEADDEERASEIITNVVRGASAATGAPATEEQVDGIDTVQANVGVATVTGATFDGRSVLTTSDTFLQALRTGETTLADDEVYQGVRDAAGAPDQMAGAMYLQTARMRDLLRAFGAGVGERAGGAGPAFGWISNDDDSQTFEVFVEMDEVVAGEGEAEGEDAGTSTTPAPDDDGTSTVAEIVPGS